MEGNMIICTSTAANDIERFSDIEELAADLHRTADPRYAEAVLVPLRRGELTVTVANGPAEDTYTVEP